MSGLLTTGDIARRFGEPDHVVNYALRRFGPEPSGHVGLTRTWMASQLPEIELALRRTALRSTLERRSVGAKP